MLTPRGCGAPHLFGVFSIQRRDGPARGRGGAQVHQGCHQIRRGVDLRRGAAHDGRPERRITLGQRPTEHQRMRQVTSQTQDRRGRADARVSRGTVRDGQRDQPATGRGDVRHQGG